MLKRGLKLWSINIDSYYQQAQMLFEKNIFDYIELYVVPDSLNTLPKWKNLNIPFIIHCPHFAHGFNLAKKEKADSNKFIYSQVKLFADELNAEYIIFHGGIDGSVEETARQLALFNEKRALIENKPYKALPNKMGGSFCRGYNYDEINYIKTVAKCNFCLDFGHSVCAANSFKHNIYDYINDFMKLDPVMFHMTDILDITSEYDSHPHLGKGELNISKILKIIPKDAIITFETVKNSQNDLNDFIEDMEYLKALR